jgi:hypothetical protein
LNADRTQAHCSGLEGPMFSGHRLIGSGNGCLSDARMTGAHFGFHSRAIRCALAI